MNTQEFRDEINAKMLADGVRIQEFSKEHQVELIKTYAAVILANR